MTFQAALIAQDLYAQSEVQIDSDSTISANLETAQSFIAEVENVKDSPPPPRTIKQTYMDFDGNIPPLQKRVNAFLNTLTDPKSAVIHFMATPMRENPGGPYVIFSVLIEYYVTFP